MRSGSGLGRRMSGCCWPTVKEPRNSRMDREPRADLCSTRAPGSRRWAFCGGHGWNESQRLHLPSARQQEKGLLTRLQMDRGSKGQGRGALHPGMLLFGSMSAAQRDAMTAAVWRGAEVCTTQRSPCITARCSRAQPHPTHLTSRKSEACGRCGAAGALNMPASTLSSALPGRTMPTSGMSSSGFSWVTLPTRHGSSCAAAAGPARAAQPAGERGSQHVLRCCRTFLNHEASLPTRSCPSCTTAAGRA